MIESDKVNGETTTDKTVNAPTTTQRKPRLNRRGLHLLNHPLADLCSQNSIQKNSDINGSNEESEKKEKAESSQKRIISLSSIKKTSSEKDPVKGMESKTIILKKSSSSLNKRESVETTGVSSSSDTPPKKKHKPITWP